MIARLGLLGLLGLLCLLLAAATMLPEPAVVGAWSGDTTQNTPICAALGDQRAPQIIPDGSGGAIITWEDPRSGTNNYDIYAQRVDSGGTVQWTTNGVAICTASGDQRFPQINPDGSGGAIITWWDARSGTNYDIYAQRVDSGGTVQWTTNGLAICTASGDQYRPQLVSDDSGGAIITWQDHRSGSGSPDIYARRVNSSGTVQWTADGVAICTATDGQWEPQIVSDDSGGAIITWLDERSGNADVYSQRIDSSGTVQWTTNGVAVCTATGHQYGIRIASDGSGGAVITWQDERSGNADIYVRRVDSGGTVQWTTNGEAICTAAGDQDYPQLTSDGSGGAIITWQDERSGNADIYAQRVDSSGAVKWIGNGMAICTASGYQWLPQLVSDGSGGAIITWWDYRGSDADVYAQRVDSGGAVKWATNNVAICTASGDQSVPQIISDESGGAIITWEDPRSGINNYDIYAQRVNSSGSLPVNHAPVAADDAYSTDQNVVLNVSAPGVLENDTDTDSDPLTAILVSDVSHGTLTLSSNGSFSYTPEADFAGTDSFTYKANDGAADSDLVTVTINVSAVNHEPAAADDEYGVPGDTTLVVEAPGVLENDSDADGDTLSSVLVSTTSHGSLTLNSDGSFTYTPVASYDGSDSFTYKANDGTADSNTVTVNISVHSVNHTPVAVDDDYSTSQDTGLEIPAWLGVLANDTDQDGDYLNAELVSNASHGTLGLNPDGVFTYVPDTGFTGTDSFTYKATDGLADSNVATVTITVNAVNHAPAAADDAYSTDQNVVLNVSAPGVLGNDSDVDGDPLTASLVSDVSHGTLVLNADGSFAYTPAAGFVGADFFTYRANDGAADSDLVTVNITVDAGAVNDAPVASDDEYGVPGDATLVVEPPGVLANDSDADDDTLSSVLVSTTSHGSLTLNSDGSFTYTPDAGFSGTDSFTYKANDGTADSNTATVTINVHADNHPPVAVDDEYSTGEDTGLEIPASSGVLANDTDQDGDYLNAVLVSNASHGTVGLNIDGFFTYVPAANFNGTDSFTYKASDGLADSDVATVTITVNAINDLPLVADDAYSTDRNVVLNESAPGVLGNDSDVDSDPLTASLVSDVSHGTLVLNADGSFTYTPADGFVGADFFTYRANDGAADSDLVTVTITVAEVPPSIASLDNSEASPGETVTVVITGTKLSGATKVDFGPGVTVEGFTVDSPNQITVDIKVASDAEPGPRDVSVTTPQGVVTLPDAFTVGKAPSGGTPFWIWLVVALAVIAAGVGGFLLLRRRAKPS